MGWKVQEQGKFQLRPHTTPFPEENSILGVIYGVLLWADMNAATPLGPRGRSAMSLEETRSATDTVRHCQPLYTLGWPIKKDPK